MDLRTPSGRQIEFVKNGKIRLPQPEPKPRTVTTEFETRKSLLEIANERFVEALKLYFSKGGKA